MLPELADKTANIPHIAKRACSDASLLSEVVDGLKLKVNTKSPEETVRYNCYKVLMQITETKGSMLYPRWQTFVEMLNSHNSYHKMAGVQLIAGLAKSDVNNQFQKITDTYFGLLDDPSVIVAIYVASTAGKIVNAKPALEPQVTGKLLGIPRTHHTASRKALVAGGAIEAFGQYVERVADRGPILEFVAAQEQSESPKTRKLAKAFTGKWAK